MWLRTVLTVALEQFSILIAAPFGIAALFLMAGKSYFYGFIAFIAFYLILSSFSSVADIFSKKEIKEKKSRVAWTQILSGNMFSMSFILSVLCSISYLINEDEKLIYVVFTSIILGIASGIVYFGVKSRV